MVQIRRRCTRATVCCSHQIPLLPFTTFRADSYPRVFPLFPLPSLSSSLFLALTTTTTITVNSPAKNCGLASTSSPPSKPKKTATKSVATWPTRRAKRPCWVIMPACTTVIGGQRLHLPLRRRRGLRNRRQEEENETKQNQRWFGMDCSEERRE